MKRFVLFTMIFAVVSAAGWWLAKACGPFSDVAVFSYKRHPDFPRTEFIKGRLGVLQPSFARSYLMIAYRYLNGIGMSDGEAEQARDYYKDRGTNYWDNTGEDWPARWRAVRSKITVPIPPATSLITNGQMAYDPETHTFTTNCFEDAFRVALHTLEARRSRYGVSSAVFRSWLGAQDKVFMNCDGQGASIPPPASANLPPIIRADREYQIAAAYFYAGEYDTALERFRRIGQGKSTPWSTISRYLVARTLSIMTQIPASADTAQAQFKSEIDAILGDPNLQPIHGMTWKLARIMQVREADQTYFNELAGLLSSKGQDNGLREEIWNYTTLYDNAIGKSDPNAIYVERDAAPTDVVRFREADLTDWIFSFQSPDPAEFQHCLTRWQETRSPAWLLAALEHLAAETAKSSGILTAAAALPQTSPAYLTARFHVFRLSIELGDRSSARDGLNALLSSSTVANLPSSVNLFRGLRMIVAPDFTDFLRFALRKPVMITDDVDYAEAPQDWDKNFTKTDANGIVWNGGDYYKGEKLSTPIMLFDRDATHILNYETPYRLLKEAALGNALPLHLRREALVVTFTRGLILGQDISEITKNLGQVQPEVVPFTDAYSRETTDQGHRFAAAFLLLHQPEARPYFGSGVTRQSAPGKLDDYRDNWWCHRILRQSLIPRPTLKRCSTDIGRSMFFRLQLAL